MLTAPRRLLLAVLLAAAAAAHAAVVAGKSAFSFRVTPAFANAIESVVRSPLMASPGAGGLVGTLQTLPLQDPTVQPSLAPLAHAIAVELGAEGDAAAKRLMELVPEERVAVLRGAVERSKAVAESRAWYLALAAEAYAGFLARGGGTVEAYQSVTAKLAAQSLRSTVRKHRANGEALPGVRDEEVVRLKAVLSQFSVADEAGARKALELLGAAAREMEALGTLFPMYLDAGDLARLETARAEASQRHLKHLSAMEDGTLLTIAERLSPRGTQVVPSVGQWVKIEGIEGVLADVAGSDPGKADEAVRRLETESFLIPDAERRRAVQVLVAYAARASSEEARARAVRALMRVARPIESPVFRAGVKQALKSWREGLEEAASRRRQPSLEGGLAGQLGEALVSLDSYWARADAAPREETLAGRQLRRSFVLATGASGLAAWVLPAAAFPFAGFAFGLAAALALLSYGGWLPKRWPLLALGLTIAFTGGYLAFATPLLYIGSMLVMGGGLAAVGREWTVLPLGVVVAGIGANLLVTSTSALTIGLGGGLLFFGVLLYPLWLRLR